MNDTDSAGDSVKPAGPDIMGESAKPAGPDNMGESVRPASQSPDEKSLKKRKRRRRELTRFLIKLGILGAAAAVIFIWVLGVYLYHGNRMYPFIMDGDLLIIFKPGNKYDVGDVVLYRNPITEENGISRISVAGECEVQITESGELLVNGYRRAENVFYLTEKVAGSDIRFPYSMGKDEYFLLDDYRTSGRDSRVFGAVRKEALLGKVAYVLRRRGI